MTFRIAHIKRLENAESTRSQPWYFIVAVVNLNCGRCAPDGWYYIQVQNISARDRHTLA